jgi:phage baseplate assembly protein W
LDLKISKAGTDKNILERMAKENASEFKTVTDDLYKKIKHTDNLLKDINNLKKTKQGKIEKIDFSKVKPKHLSLSEVNKDISDISKKLKEVTDTDKIERVIKTTFGSDVKVDKKIAKAIKDSNDVRSIKSNVEKAIRPKVDTVKRVKDLATKEGAKRIDIYKRLENSVRYNEKFERVAESIAKTTDNAVINRKLRSVGIHPLSRDFAKLKSKNGVLKAMKENFDAMSNAKDYILKIRKEAFDSVIKKYSLEELVPKVKSFTYAIELAKKRKLRKIDEDIKSLESVIKEKQNLSDLYKEVFGINKKVDLVNENLSKVSAYKTSASEVVVEDIVAKYKKLGISENEILDIKLPNG